ncbi:MAG TPA: TonB family protein [Vicinamibacterales bacterium]|nr:TonB family protein [Vicinamibacterales bacterium]
MVLRRSARVAVALLGWLAVATPAWAQQETLARAKDYYASAAYEEALDVLRKLTSAAPDNDAREIAVYKLFCLLALGRLDETKKTIETIVRADPLYHLSEDAASPRVRTLFEDTRRPLLPGIVKDLYTKAKAAYDRKDSAEATAGFDRVIALIDDGGLADSPGIGDILTLATGFRDLIRVPPPTGPPPPTAPVPAPKTDPSPPPSTPPAKPAGTGIYGPEDRGAVRPVPISNQLPAWRPASPTDSRLDFHGALELIIDETGNVTSAVIRKSVHRAYDPLLVEAAQRWTFQPATVNGIPVRYRYVLEVHLKPGGEFKDRP